MLKCSKAYYSHNPDTLAHPVQAWFPGGVYSYCEHSVATSNETHMNLAILQQLCIYHVYEFSFTLLALGDQSGDAALSLPFLLLAAKNALIYDTAYP